MELLKQKIGMSKYEVTQLGEELQNLKRNEKTTFDKMAHAARITPSFLSSVVRGRGTISLTALNAIAKKFGRRVIIMFVKD